jgi:kynureninase
MSVVNCDNACYSEEKRIWELEMSKTRNECLALDREDVLSSHRDLFHLPPGMIYLDGNSLGVLPKNVLARVTAAVEQQWGETLIKSWNEHGWFQMAQKIGNRLGRLLGAEKDSVIVADSISVNLFKILSCALGLRRDRKIILTDSGNFPSDVYVAQGLAQFMANGYEVKVVAPEDVASAINDHVAVVMVTEVDYRTARRHDMKALTKLAHSKGALMIWDLAHSAGAVPVDLKDGDADFAVGCTYKYLNGGPGSPAFLYVKPELQNQVQPALVGWWGHARPFAFDLHFEPAPGIIRQQCGTQPILSMAALDAALDAWDDVDMQVLHRKSKAQCQLLIDLVETNCAKHGITAAGPRDMNHRGSHVSFKCEQGYPVMQAMIAQGVIGDFRAPDIIRFGITPLYNSFADIWDAAAMLTRILDDKLWNTPEFLAKKAVT